MRITEITEKKIEELIAKMTLEEKVGMCHANSKFTSGGVPRLNIDELSMSDGPHGVRSEFERDNWVCLNREEDKCTYLPTESALAATFNTDLAKKFGETLGSEARHRGKDIILGPGVNIIRTPLCGRNFEYLSEDPVLTSKMAVQIVKGIEEQDVSACVKHFALNNQELDRSGVNVEVSDRALNEIYLKAFYGAVTEGGASSVMGAYNKYKGQHLCHNANLVNKVLKEKWGFKGVYLSDWNGCHDTDEAIFGGLDIEMGTEKPYNEYYLADEFLKRAENDTKVREILDQKVRRILRLMFSVNKFSKDRKQGEFNTKKHQKTAYGIASEAMILLKNEDNILPIKPESKEKILVIGENAVKKHAEGGSSSGIRPLYEITPFEGIKNRFGDICDVEYESGNFNFTGNPIPTQLLGIVETGAGVRAFKITAIRNINGEIKRKVTYSADAVIEDKTADSYIIEYSIVIPKSGKYLFNISSTVGVKFNINDKQVLDQQTNIWNASRGICTKYDYAVSFTEGEEVHFKLYLSNEVKNAVFDLTWTTPSDIENLTGEKEFYEKVRKADYVIFCGGLDHSLDTEGADRRNMELPAKQIMMIEKIAEANKNIILILTAGSPIEMAWIDKVKAVLWMWYAGMEGGNALADILRGKVVPSGKMPFTMPQKYEDCPVARYGEHKRGNCRYNEDIFVGYRGFERDNIKPLFPFGFGLSYAEFEYSDLRVTRENNGIKIQFNIKNKSNIAARETALVFVGQKSPAVERPKKELMNFSKINLNPKEKKQISVFVSQSDMSFYDENIADFRFAPDEYTVFVGSSAEDIRLCDTILIK